MSARKEVLIQVRNSIQSDEYIFICNALQRVIGFGSATQKSTALELQAEIRNLLSPHACYENWLLSEHREFWDAVSENQCAKSGRLQWLDYLIQNCK
jgi:hypothetical protein